MLIEFPAPARVYSINQSQGQHWSKFHADKVEWQSAAEIYVRQWYTFGQWFDPPPSTVTVTLPFKTNHRRDPHNYTGTVVKAIIDGLVLAGLFEDDTAEYVTVADPILVKDLEMMVRIEIEPR